MVAVSTCVFVAMMHFEGLRLRAYWDHGSYAIGYGHHRGVHRGQTCTLEQAVVWLAQDVARASECVDDLTQGVPMTRGEHEALVDFCFNAGPGSLQHSTLLWKFKRGDHAGAAREFGRWVHANHLVHAGLVKRRAAERRWFDNKGCGPEGGD